MEGVAIIAAVLIVAVVTATNDFSKEQQFRALSEVNDDVFVKVFVLGSCAFDCEFLRRIIEFEVCVF